MITSLSFGGRDLFYLVKKWIVMEYSDTSFTWLLIGNLKEFLSKLVYDYFKLFSLYYSWHLDPVKFMFKYYAQFDFG